MESEDQIAQEKHGRRISLEKSILVESITQEYERCCCIQYNIFPEKIKARLLDPESDDYCINDCLVMVFNLPKYMNLMKKLTFLQFFNVNKVELYLSKMKNKHILNFVDFSFPNKTNELYTSANRLMKLNRATYFNSFVRINSKVTQRVLFKFFYLSLYQLKRLVAAYRHVKRLDLLFCKLSIPTVPDFSKVLTNCQIQEICLLGTGGKSYSNWGDHPEEFKHLIQGFSTSLDLRLSLREVSILNCEIKKDETQKIFAYNQLEGVKINGGS
ncbi:unnamed protein product [Moneuplotes crassus]|uniref:Uncharacterized protein n=1 Tax=Euplotes crassus TaxID=5936 RepID=A0AAD1X1W6_EUPCR|nr:unnamed protein product [Moneuplotes crassus]